MKKILLLLCVLLCSMVSYAQQENDSVVPNEDTTEIEEIFVTDHQASFPGGIEALNAYLSENIKYPPEAEVTGKVYVQFVIEKDGSISNVEVKRDIGAGCGEEAVRVVKSMPKWNPALTLDGKPVRSYFLLPVSFNLRAADEESKPIKPIKEKD